MKSDDACGAEGWADAPASRYAATVTASGSASATAETSTSTAHVKTAVGFVGFVDSVDSAGCVGSSGFWGSWEFWEFWDFVVSADSLECASVGATSQSRKRRSARRPTETMMSLKRRATLIET